MYAKCFSQIAFKINWSMIGWVGNNRNEQQ